MKIEEFIAIYKKYNSWSDNSPSEYQLPPIPIKWVKPKKHIRPINTLPLGTKHT